MTGSPTVTLVIFNCDSGDDHVHELPGKWEICSTCRGNGRHSINLGAFTRSDLDELGPEWCEDYFAGNYDESCEPCHGTGKIVVIDEARCDPALLAAYEADQDEEAEYQAMVAAERRMGC